ncbi:DUF2759 domain-containing protein [Aquibacillus koreensis]|uniref:DUF2759 domain-containing protein n=1 Tax=Aquibacillus koreensis TaxID=279446 RepID=A0A9X3WIH9_9BACI|nr:DUF2759 domain-containing protein [Aquibacillus koreensis]MCT2537555.1 DUF2759 domain-containing protein [Aquibacillus koreensis]MDC3419001.1 DUF2759 domain-containing protein [Aquibacillus koreensis]
MVLAVLFLLIAILCVIAVFRELKSQNFFAVGFAGISTLVFGFFAIATMYAEIVAMLTENTGTH